MGVWLSERGKVAAERLGNVAALAREIFEAASTIADRSTPSGGSNEGSF
jgi:hypothetical protein